MPTDPTMVDYAGDPNNYPDELRLVTDATRGFADRINLSVEGLADRTEFLRDWLLQPLLVRLFAGQQAPTALNPNPMFTPHRIDPAGADTKRGGWLQTDLGADGGGIWWYVPISYRVKVTMVAASIRGDDGAGTNPGFPAAPDRPFMRLYRQPIDGSDAVELLTLADETASKAEYEGHHTIPLDPDIPFVTPLVFAPGEYLVIWFSGHKGANVGVNTLKLYGIEIRSEPA